jgi:hypothetical protein
MKNHQKAVIGASLCASFLMACAQGDAQKATNVNGTQNSNASNSAAAMPTPSNKFAEADVAKLKWIEGSWKGMDGDKPFYERYKLNGSALVVETLKDESGKEVIESGRFELRNGEFGKEEDGRRSAASEIGDGFVQFVPAPGSKGNMFRFERKSTDTWDAILEMPSNPDPEKRRKVYVMERIK